MVTDIFVYSVALSNVWLLPLFLLVFLAVKNPWDCGRVRRAKCLDAWGVEKSIFKCENIIV